MAPKPFDSIVPAELPGSARFYTYASGVAELATAALLLAPRTRRLGALAAVALFIAVFPANVNMVRLWWDKPLADAARRDRPAAAADPDDHRGAEDLRATLRVRRRSSSATSSSAPGSVVGDDGAPAAHVVERRAHRRLRAARAAPPTPAGRRAS